MTKDFILSRKLLRQELFPRMSNPFCTWLLFCFCSTGLDYLIPLQHFTPSYYFNRPEFIQMIVSHLLSVYIAVISQQLFYFSGLDLKCLFALFLPLALLCLPVSCGVSDSFCGPVSTAQHLPHQAPFPTEPSTVAGLFRGRVLKAVLLALPAVDWCWLTAQQCFRKLFRVKTDSSLYLHG